MLDGLQAQPAVHALTCGLELTGSWATSLLGVLAGSGRADESAGAATGRPALLVASFSNAWLRR